MLSTEGAFLVMELVSGEKPFAGKSYHELLTAMSGEIEFDSDARIVKFPAQFGE